MKQTISTPSAASAVWVTSQVTTPLVDKILKKVSSTAKRGDGGVAYLTKSLWHAEIAKTHAILTARGFKVTYRPTRTKASVPYNKYCGPYHLYVSWL